MVGPKHRRLWLPKQLCVRLGASLMVGWVNTGLKSVDVVVVAGCPVFPFSNPVVALQEILDSAEMRLPGRLRSQRKLLIVGEFWPATDIDSTNEGTHWNIQSGRGSIATDMCTLRPGSLRSPGLKMDSSTTCGQGSDTRSSQGVASDANVWAVVSARKSKGTGNALEWMPYVLSLYLGGCSTLGRDHIITYCQPVFGSHHFSSVPWTSSHELRCHHFSRQNCRSSFSWPQWLTALEQQEQSLDMEILMLELNCSTFIDGIIKDFYPPSGASQKLLTAYSVCCTYLWYGIAVTVAMLATMLYGLAVVLTSSLSTFPNVLSSFLNRGMAWPTMLIRCEQLMAWPFILLWGGLGPEQANMAVAHKLAITRHSLWSSLLIDKTMGALVGFLLLQNRASITEVIIQTGQSLTNDILRTGCVWLMGVPAGFKLNNELAAAFGTLSLHIIQCWSTVFYTLVPWIGVFLDILGVSGFLLGFTVTAAMLADVVFLSTFHVFCLYHAIAFLHTNQLQALAALWRLFRGRKRNPLRGRLDTFDCTVEQLVVGSLMFTSLLLLLPTTSVFYTFFSMIFLTLSTMQVLLQCVIAIFHWFPFALVGRWIIRPGQFPSGVWLQMPRGTSKGTKEEKVLLSTLAIRTASFDELLGPYVQRFLATLEWSSVASFVHKLVSGERFNLNLQLTKCGSLPHAPVNLKGFVHLCYMAILVSVGSYPEH